MGRKSDLSASERGVIAGAKYGDSSTSETATFLGYSHTLQGLGLAEDREINNM